MENPLKKYEKAIAFAKRQPKGMVLSAHNVLADVAIYALQLEDQLESYNQYCADGQAFEGPRFWTDRIEAQDKYIAHLQSTNKNLVNQAYSPHLDEGGLRIPWITLYSNCNTVSSDLVEQLNHIREWAAQPAGSLRVRQILDAVVRMCGDVIGERENHE